MPPETLVKDEAAKADGLTELSLLDARIVSGVTNPANGTPFLFLKSREDDDPASTGDQQSVEKAEADEIEELLTKGVCGDDECSVCVKTLEGVPGELASKAKLAVRDRKRIPKSQFADPEDDRLPVHDAAHTRNAISRFNQTDFSSPKTKRRAAGRIKRKAKQFGINVGGDSNVNKDLEDGWAEIIKASSKPVGPGVVPGALNKPRQKGAISRSGDLGSGGPNEGGSRTNRSGKQKHATIVCPKCKGKGGVVPGKPGVACSQCNGKGFVPRREKDVNTAKRPPQIAHMTERVLKGDDDPDLDDDSITVDDDGPAEKSKGKKKSVFISGDNPRTKLSDLDSKTLDSVDRGLETAKKAIADLRSNQPVEVDADSIVDTLGFVAHLMGSGAAIKSIRPETMTALAAARIQLTSVLGDVQIDQGESEMPTTLTKDQFGDLLKASAAKGAKSALKKQAKEQVKKAKTSNNKGEVTEGAIRAKGRRKIASNLRGVPMSGSGKVRKNKKNKPNPALAEITKSLGALTEQVTAFSKRPRSGGPVLDGQPRAFSAGDRSGNLAKSDGDTEIQELTKELKDVLAKSGPENAARASELSFKLTQAKLYAQHCAELGITE